MKNYLCRPERKDRVTKLLSLALLVLSVLTFYLSSLFPSLKAIGQLLSVVMLLLFVQITTKYLLTDYRYGFEEGCLVLSSRQGKQEKSLGSIPITSESLLLTRKEWEEKKKDKHKRPAKSFSYCQNLFPENPYYLLTPEGDGFVLLVFEPDKPLLALLKKQIQSNQSHNKGAFDHG